jgi:hypothetical protein
MLRIHRTGKPLMQTIPAGPAPTLGGSLETHKCRCCHLWAHMSLNT